ncbi:MAG: AraC family transcriptional regulator [Candidatus Sumerlaeota bacterium]
MEKEITKVHAWRFDPLPITARFWPQVVGSLQGFGSSSRANVQPVLHPHLIVEGRGTFENPFGTFRITRGDLFFLWPGVPHEFREDRDDPFFFYWMRLTGEQTDRLGREWGASPEKPVIHTLNPDLSAQGARALFDYWGREERDPYEGLALFHHFIAVSRNQKASPTASVRTPADIVAEARTTAESLLETGINVGELADHLSVNRSTLWRAFQQETRLSPVEYLHRLRIERARTLLENTEHKIASIARMCGFRDEKYFHKRFRELENRTPGQYRENRRQI